MAINFVARDGDKLAFPIFIVCAGIFTTVGKITKTYTHRETIR